MLSALVVNGQPHPHPHPHEQGELPVPWWSSTKTVLATTALSLVRDRLIGLDDLVFDQPYTLRQLLRHEAGLADYGELGEYHQAVANGESAWSVDEMLKRLDGARLRYSPGAGWRYSNVGYLLIGRLIERLTDLTLEEAVNQRVLTPLGLSNVRFAKTRADLETSHVVDTLNYDPAWVYHGLLTGSVSQAALFLDRLFCADLLSAGLLAEMRGARTLGGLIPGRPWIAPSYGLGLMQGTLEGGYALSGHTGCGPSSAIAVYWVCDGEVSASGATFQVDASEGAVEAIVVEQLMQALRQTFKGL